MAGYSQTPLVKKLGIKEDFKVYLFNTPDNYMEMIQPLPAGVVFTKQANSDTDMIHLFSKSKAELSELLNKFLYQVKSSGMIWVSWPKKSAKVASDISEDSIRDIALPLGLVDIKVCAVDDTWSGLKLVMRKENRK